MRTTTFAPALAASGATTRASPPGADSPLGSCLPPGAICTNVFGCSGSTRLSAGTEAVSSPYRPPEATWVTVRYGWLASTTRVDAADAVDADTATPATVPATVAAAITAAMASRAATFPARRLGVQAAVLLVCDSRGRDRDISV